MLMPALRAVAGPQWGFAAAGWLCYPLPLCAAEAYIRLAGRFVERAPDPAKELQIAGTGENKGENTEKA